MSKDKRIRHKEQNPCLKETEASSKCMDENHYQKDMCTMYFLQYKRCRKFWSDVMAQRRKDGVTPYMPTAEERESILQSLGSVPY
ncbi:coiled-coil-helix-coiled-coil-helix domain-containing protein 7 [Pelodytes ibericus]